MPGARGQHPLAVFSLIASIALVAIIVASLVDLPAEPPAPRTPHVTIGSFFVRAWLEPGETRVASLPCADNQTGSLASGLSYLVRSDNLVFTLNILLVETNLSAIEGVPVRSIEWIDSANRTDEFGKAMGQAGEVSTNYTAAGHNTVDHIAACRDFEMGKSVYLSLRALVSLADGSQRNLGTTLVLLLGNATMSESFVKNVGPQCPLPPCIPASRQG